MTSNRIRSVAADSNVLLSAIAGQAARRVFERAPDMVVVSTLENKAEIDRDYEGFRFGLFTTAQLLKALDS